MRESNSIYKFDIEQSELLAVKVAEIVSPHENPKESFSFSLKTTEDLTSLLSKSTQLFHQHYFKLQERPLIVVYSTFLEDLFLEKIDNLSFGEFTIINLEVNNELVSFQPVQSNFRKWYNEGNIEDNFYFISKELNEFNKWKKTLTQHQINQLIHTFTLGTFIFSRNAIYIVFYLG